MAPVPADAFMDAVFDDRPLLVSRPDSPRYYAPWFSRAVIDDLLRHALARTHLTSSPVILVSTGRRELVLQTWFAMC